MGLSLNQAGIPGIANGWAKAWRQSDAATAPEQVLHNMEVVLEQLGLHPLKLGQREPARVTRVGTALDGWQGL